MRHRLTLGLMFLAVFAMPLGAGEENPATKPAGTQPTGSAGGGREAASGDLASIKRLIVNLADDNYLTREASRLALMGLKRADLPILREAVKRSLPLEPSQAGVLREIVTQVYLSGEPYPSADNAPGFLGISLANRIREEDQGLLTIERGIAVISRFPGFCAFRMLQTGDVILAMTSPKPVEFKSPDPEDLFMQTVKSVGAGQTITFEVLRQGQIIRVSLTLDLPRPSGLENPGAPQEFISVRADKAEEYWNKDFAPLLSDTIG